MSGRTLLGVTAALIERVGAECYRQWWSTEAFVAAPALATEKVAER